MLNPETEVSLETKAAGQWGNTYGTHYLKTISLQKFYVTPKVHKI